jgi:hypothetical protein
VSHVSDVVERRLRSNGDWNINDWKDVARALALEVARLESRCPFCFYTHAGKDDLAAHLDTCSGSRGYQNLTAKTAVEQSASLLCPTGGDDG